MRVYVLGTAQDAGIPQADCLCAHCKAAIRDPKKRRLPASVAVEDRAGRRFLADATPAFPAQAIRLRRLAGARQSSGRSLPFDGILLTHAHMGHYTGLLYLGREAAHTRRMALWATRPMRRFLSVNRPFSYLVERGEVRFRTLRPGKKIALTATLEVTAISVPHRNEDADTVCYLFEEVIGGRQESGGLGGTVRGGRQETGDRRQKIFLYLPDADYFPDNIVRLMRTADLALVDGTFYTHDEVARGRSDARRIPHPPISRTAPLVAGACGRVLYTHLNHTNRLLSRHNLMKHLAHLGLGVARDGQVISL